MGRKNDPSFRIVVTDSQNGPKSGRFIEVVGSYDARRGEPNLKVERIKHWLAVGAQPSGTVHNLLVSQKVIDATKINVLPKKRPIIKESTEAEKAEAAAPAEVVAEATPAEETAPTVESKPAEPGSAPEAPEPSVTEKKVVAETTKDEVKTEPAPEVEPESVVETKEEKPTVAEAEKMTEPSAVETEKTSKSAEARPAEEVKK